MKGIQSDKNIPPDVRIERDNVTIRCGERETVVTKDEIRIRERRKKGATQMQTLKMATTWDVYHGAVPEIEATVRSEEVFEALRQAIKKMSRQRVRHGGSRIEYSIKLVG